MFVKIYLTNSDIIHVEFIGGWYVTETDLWIAGGFTDKL